MAAHQPALKAAPRGPPRLPHVAAVADDGDSVDRGASWRARPPPGAGPGARRRGAGERARPCSPARRPPRRAAPGARPDRDGTGRAGGWARPRRRTPTPPSAGTARSRRQARVTERAAVRARRAAPAARRARPPRLGRKACASLVMSARTRRSRRWPRSVPGPLVSPGQPPLRAVCLDPGGEVPVPHVRGGPADLRVGRVDDDEPPGRGEQVPEVGLEDRVLDQVVDDVQGERQVGGEDPAAVGEARAVVEEEALGRVAGEPATGRARSRSATRRGRRSSGTPRATAGCRHRSRTR